MQNMLVILLVAAVGSVSTHASVAPGGSQQLQPATDAANTGELKIEIHSRPPTNLYSTSEKLAFEVEGVASTIGGVRFIDMLLVLDTSMSLRDSDPYDYRAAAAIGLVRSLAPKSDIRIGVIGFNDAPNLLQPLTADRQSAIMALQNLKRSGGTNLAAGIESAVNELNDKARAESSRVIVLFTDGMSNEQKARAAAEQAQSNGIAIQTMLLGENLKGGFLLEDIAAATGGSFVWVLDPSELPDAFRNLRTTGVDTVTLSVNGSKPVHAELTAGAFKGTVPLAAGDNRIVALATSLDGRTETSEITVTVADASCASLKVGAVQDGRPALSLNERSVEIVVDASRSMWGQIDGRSKMAIAKDILHEATASLPEDLNLALRAYGSASASDANDCSDSRLLVPFGSASRAPIHAAISELMPKGQTPIAHALQQAAADFGTLQSEGTLVLVTDGKESCGGDPVAVARELRQQGVKIHVISFGLGNTADEDTASLRAIAVVSGGHFFTANSADELKQALEATVGTRYFIWQEDRIVARGFLGSDQPLYLPRGEYRLELDSRPAQEVRFSLAPRDELTLTLNKTGQKFFHDEHRDLLSAATCDELIAADGARKRAELMRSASIFDTEAAGDGPESF